MPVATQTREERTAKTPRRRASHLSSRQLPINGKSLKASLVVALLLGLLCAACSRPEVTPTIAAADPTSAPASDESPTAPTEAPLDNQQAYTVISPPLTWEQLKNATYSLPEERGGPRGGLIPMQDGAFSALPAAGSPGTTDFALVPNVAYGDLNGDGAEDALVILANESAATGSFYHLLPVLNIAGELQPLSPTAIGDRVFVDQLQIVDGEGHLLFRTYRSDEPLGSTPTLQRFQRFVLRGDSLALLSEEELKTDEMVRQMAPRPVITFDLPEAGGRIIHAGQTNPSHLDRFAVPLTAGQKLTVTLTTPHQDAFLSLFGADSHKVLASSRDELTSWQGAVPETENYAVNVFAIGSETPFELTIQAGPPTELSETGDSTATPTEDPETEGKVIYLTFDDGPTPPYTDQVLDLLAQYGASATFFVVGLNAAAFPELLEQTHQAGHTLANHTWDHLSLAGMGQSAFNQTMQRTAEAIGPAAAPCLRPPYGATDAFTRAYAAELGYEVIMWTIDPVDWRRPGAYAISANVLANAYPGAIVLMHDGGGERTQTVAALEVVLRELSQQGYTFEALCQ